MQHNNCKLQNQCGATIARSKARSTVKLQSVIMLFSIAKRQIPSTLRSFSSTSASSNGSGGAGFFSRVGSFIAGAALTALATEIYIFKEVREGNLQMLQKQRELEKRIAKLEKK